MKVLTALHTDVAHAAQFLNRLDPTGVFTFQTFDDSDRKDLRLARVFHGTLAEHADALTRLNQLGAGVFVMVNRGDGVIHDGKKTCRCNGNVISIRAQFADADGVPLKSVLEKSPPPHILVESSPGKWHFYWLTSDTPLDVFSTRQLTLAKHLGTDPAVKDLARVLRLPGFYHQKNEPFMTRLVEEAAA